MWIRWTGQQKIVEQIYIYIIDLRSRISPGPFLPDDRLPPDILLIACPPSPPIFSSSNDLLRLSLPLIN